MSKDYKKLYEDVVALAKDGLTDGLYLSRSAKDVTEFLFPQLKKSENERISKKLIQLLQNGGRLPDEEHKQALSWLEKQSKIKLTHYDSAEKEKSDFVNGQFIQCRRSFNEFKEDESYLLEYIGDDTYIGKSDNVLDEEFYITPQQLFTLFTHQHCFSSESEQGSDENNEDCNEINNNIDYSSEIIGFLKNYVKAHGCTAMNSWVKWLESLLKDKAQLHPKQEWSKKDEKIIKKIIESLQRYMPTDELSEEQDMIAWLEKQFETSVDKVEPKFKVGDWIIHNKNIKLANSLMLVTGKNNNEYLCKDIAGQCSYNIEFIDKDYHLWTIQDANDGDVLALNNEYFLFKEKKNSTTECYISHCFIDSAKTFRENGEFLPIERGNKVCPTTKEQYDLLFSKMKEAGYEWDAEKKELKNIEQGCYHNDGLYYAIDILEKTFGKVEGYQSDDGKMEHQIAIETVNALYHKKSVEWSEEDEQYLQKAIECAFGNGYLSVSDWLKSLKDRVQPQPKQKWGEDDEKRINSIISSIKYCSEQYPDKKEYAKDIDWIKSLKSHWKPSEEQIGALNYAYCELFKRGENSEGSNCVHPLMTLIDDLKKL